MTRIYGSGFDTFADARFYSWRRDGAKSGRMASLIWLQKTSRHA
ncbi:MAG TPA: laccase domain-containing protein [Rudaea sp.]|nr:laccase domain-containing protein [Rudaea sp.]